MIVEKLNKLAVFISPLKRPALIIAIALLIVAITATFNVKSREEDFLLIPSLAGCLWFFCLYALIANFQEIPRKVAPEDGFFKRIKIRLYWLWFLVLGWLFILVTGLILFLSSRLVTEMNSL